MNSVTKAIYKQQLRAAGVQLEYCVLPGIGRRLCHAGIPIFESNFITEDVIPQPPVFNTQIFLIVLGRENDGLYGIFNQDVGDNGVVVAEGFLDNSRDQQFTEVSWNVGMVLGSRSSLVCIDLAGLTTPPPLV